jgi:hypothetical protein
LQHSSTTEARIVVASDKATRAQSFRGRMAMLRLYVPILASWYSALRSELLSFPAGKYDDQVDALGLIGQLLDRITAGQRPITPRVEKPNPYRPMYEEFQECSIKLLCVGRPWKTARHFGHNNASRLVASPPHHAADVDRPWAF